MTSHGIILRNWEARAIVEGRKTQMRFIVKPQPHPFVWKYEQLKNGLWQGYERDSDRNRPRGEAVKMPYSVGDQLWGRETWAYHWPGSGSVFYRAGGELGKTLECYSSWRSPATMPRWASRILLEVTQVHVQRVQEIATDDAEAEGALRWWNEKLKAGGGLPILHPKETFARLWNSIHGPDAWDRNDWVRAVTFKRLEGGAA